MSRTSESQEGPPAKAMSVGIRERLKRVAFWAGRIMLVSFSFLWVP